MSNHDNHIPLMSLNYVIKFAHLIRLVKGIKDAPIFDKSLTHGDIKIAASTTGVFCTIHSQKDWPRKEPDKLNAKCTSSCTS